MSVFFDERDEVPSPEGDRRKKIAMLDLLPEAEATPEQVQDLNIIRRAAWEMDQKTLPACIEVEAAFRDDHSCRILVYENPDELENA